jgi:hypothetical protein
MTRRINYEDDIFTVALQVRCLQDALKLEVDPDLFKDRLLGDAAWIDGISARLYQSLRDSALFVHRQEHLRELAKLKRAFAGALDAIVSRKAPIAEHLGDSMERLRDMRDRHLRDINDIKSLIEGAGTPEEEHIVSAEELKFLMTADDSEEE